MRSMTCDVERLISALVGAQLLQQRKQAERDGEAAALRPVVTLSCGMGTGGEALARRIAATLDLCCYDRDIVDAVARRAQVDVELVESLEAHARLSRGQWWHGILKGEALSPDDYRRHVGKVVLALACHGGVIIGHGANLILGPERAFRVRVTGSLTGRAQRVASDENCDPVRARERVEAQDAQRRDNLRRLFGADIDDASGYDLVLNADRWTLQLMTDIVLFALRTARGTTPRALPARTMP